MVDRVPSHYHNRSESAGLPPPALDDGSRTSNPTSTLLHDMLRDKKAENRRLSRNFDIDSSFGTSGNGLGDRDIQSSPISSSASGRGGVGHERRSSAIGGRITSATKGMGVREMEEVSCSSVSHVLARNLTNRFIQHVSKLNKQNFDLKLELFHRRQRNDTLEAELEKMKTLEIENGELQNINDDLLRELELRDVAVKEAVALICELEAKIEGADLPQQLQSDHGLEANTIRGSYAEARIQHVRETPKTPPPLQSPADQLSPLRRPPKSEVQNDLPTVTLGRTPSFLRDKKPSTSALRSVYQSDGNPSYISLNRAGSPIRSREPDSETLNSPRLSMLSESSFLSVYGKSPKLSGTSDESEAALTSLEAPSDRTTGGLEISKKRTPIDSAKQQRNRVLDNRSDPPLRGRVDQASRRQQDPAESRRDVSSDSVSRQSFKDRLEHMSLDERSNTPTSRDRETSRWLDQSMSGDETSPLQKRTRRQRSSKSGRKSPSSGADGNFSSISEVLHEAPNHKREQISALPSLGGPIFGGPNILPPTPGTMSTHKDANSSTQSIITERSLGDIGGFPARNLSAMIPDDRPHTAGTQGTTSERYIDDSDEEQQSVQAQQSEAHTDAFIKESLHPSFSFTSVGSSSKAMQMMGSIPTRPPLTSYATNIMFDGDGIEEVQPSRGMSYPSPKESRRRYAAYTPTRLDHGRTASVQTQISPRDTANSSATPTPNAAATTPSKPSPLKPSSHHKSSIISSQSKDSEAVPTPEIPTESKIPRTVSSRLGFAGLKNPFRRSISHGVTGPPLAAEGNDISTADSQPPSRIGRPGTGVAASFGGMKMNRSASLKVKGPSDGKKG